MTDQAVVDEKVDDTNEEQETNSPAEVKEPAVKREDLPPLAIALLTAADPVYAELTETVATIDKVGDVGKLLSEGIEQSEDKRVVALRNKAEAAIKAANDAMAEAEKLVKPTLDIPSEAELAALDTKQKDLSGTLQSFANAFATEVKRNKVDESVTLFSYTGDIPGRKRGAKAGQGKGTSRPRVKSVEFTHDKNGEEGWQRVGDADSSTFSHLLQNIKKETGESLSANDLHQAWYEQNRVSDWSEANEVTTFTYNVTGKDKSTFYYVRVTK